MASGLLFVRTKRVRQVRKFATFLGYCTLGFALIACGGSGDTPPSGITTTADITLTPPSPSIQVGQTQQFVATAKDINGTPIPEVTFTWVSSNPAVASITSSGLATGHLVASTTITATDGTVSSNASTLTVTPSNLASITLTPPAPSIQVGQTHQFVATAKDINGTPIPGVSFTWTSSNPGFATISNSGLATGVSAGSTTITATNGTVSSNPSSILTVTIGGGGGRFYTTQFPLTENPISEGGNWINGQIVGLDWKNARTTPGLAFGTQTGNGGYDDTVALLTGAWGPDQTVEATVYTVNLNPNIFEEVELRLRSSLSANSCTGYEVLFGLNGYIQIVRWNGPLGNFTALASAPVPAGITTGNVVKATIVGSTITAYINGVQKLQVIDSTYPSGRPGMGFFLQGAGGVNSDYGFTRFTASD